MKKKVILSVLLLASCLSLGSCRIVGIKGDTGPTGPSGAQGEKGEDGKDGDDGESPTITISDDGYWVINGVKSNVKATGQKGEDGQKGQDGVSIQNIEKTSTSGSVDTYTITYSDGSTSTFKVTNGVDGNQGIQGEKGDDGRTPTITISEDGYWVIDGVKSTVLAKGEKGEEGQKGKDGVSIQNIEKTSTSGSVDTYTITYSDGSTSTFKVTNGVDGNQGIQGEKGDDGRTPTITISEDGYWVIDGVKSTTLAQGVKGDTGEKGDSGEPGTKWIYDQGNPIDLGKTSNTGDFYFDTNNGNVFTYTNSTWNYVTNFRYKIDHNNENHEFTVYSMDEIEAALAAVKDGDKIVCGSNIEFDNNMFVTRNIEFPFDFNGYTLSNTVDICKQYDWSFFSVRSGKMIFDDSKGTGGIKAKANDCYCLDIQNDKASIEINGGSYNGNITAVYVVAGNLVINGGYFDIQQLDDESPYGFVVNAWDAYFRNGIAKMVIKGGKYHGYNPGNATSEAGANLVPDGYQVKSETSGSDTYYSVSKAQ